MTKSLKGQKLMSYGAIEQSTKSSHRFFRQMPGRSPTLNRL